MSSLHLGSRRPFRKWASRLPRQHRWPWTQLVLERLEDRLAPANVFWNVDADGFWDVAANWKDQFNVVRLPGAADDVFLDRAGGNFLITHRSGADSIRSLHAASSNFALTGGSLTLTAASDLGGAFSLSGGDLIANGAWTTSGTTTWTGGTVRGTGTVHNPGQWTLTGANDKLMSGTLENAGTIAHAGTGNLQLSIGGTNGTLNNQAPGVYDLQGD